MVKDESADFGSDRCLAMLGRYAQTSAGALRFVEGRRALRARTQLTPHGPAPSVGAHDAPSTLVFFADFTDPECARASLIATTIQNLYAGRVRLVFRQLPSPRSPDAHLLAEASLAAHAQGKFWAYYEVLFGNPQAHDVSSLLRYAKAAGLDLAKFSKALDQHTFAADVDADIELGHKLGIAGVPALFLDGKSVRVPYAVDELARLLDAR